MISQCYSPKSGVSLSHCDSQPDTLIYPEPGFNERSVSITKVPSKNLDAQRLLHHSRAFFHGSSKSYNKVFSTDYGSASPSRKQHRTDSAAKAKSTVTSFRQNDKADQMKALLALSRETRAGNCSEHAAIALGFGQALNIPNLHFAIAYGHRYVVLADLPDDDKLFATRLDSLQDCLADAWVCDPWFNVSCALSDYQDRILEKARKWEMEGKEILVNIDGTTEKATTWVEEMVSYDFNLSRITDENGLLTGWGVTLLGETTSQFAQLLSAPANSEAS